MSVTHTCREHIGNPEVGCVDCEDQFCDCGEPLTNRNSMIGSDLCDRCADLYEGETG